MDHISAYTGKPPENDPEYSRPRAGIYPLAAVYELCRKETNKKPAYMITVGVRNINNCEHTGTVVNHE